MRTISLFVILLISASISSASGKQAADSFKPLDDERWDRAAAAHLLRRAGFGGTFAEVEALAEMELSAAVDSLVEYRGTSYAPAPPPIHELVEFPPNRAALRKLTQDERREFGQKRRRADRETFEEVRLWWLERLLESPRPFEEKMTLFWHGHFTSGMREVRSSIFMQEQNEFLRRHALDNFHELLLGISKDRAMLVYLDGNRNRKESPNENYARELMELFSLGVGNYTESDIKAAARAFTGWTFDEDGFAFRRRQHDYGKKTFLGNRGRFDGGEIIEIILKQPACSRFLARKLLTFFCRPNPERKLVEAFAKVIRRHKYELRPILKQLFLSEAFFHRASRGSLIKSPVELIVSSARQFGVSILDLRAAERGAANMGQELMQPPNVKGWDGGTAWINTATMFTRYNLIAGLIGGTNPPRERRGDATSKDKGQDAASMQSMATSLAPRSRRTREAQPQYDPLPMLRQHELSGAREIVQFLAAHLLATSLSEKKTDLLVAYLKGEKGRFRISDRRAVDRLRTTIHLLCSTPEFQLY